MNSHACAPIAVLPFPVRDPLSIIDSRTYKRISKYAEMANISIDRAIVEAVNEWMDITGDLLVSEAQLVLKAARKAKRRKRI
jgi:hypothetical protein